MLAINVVNSRDFVGLTSLQKLEVQGHIRIMADSTFRALAHQLRHLFICHEDSSAASSGSFIPVGLHPLYTYIC